MPDINYVVCSGAKECRKLKNTTNIIHYNGKEIAQRPEYCYGRNPHKYNHEEDTPHICVFLNKEVKAISIRDSGEY